MGKIKYKIEFGKDDIAKVLHPILKVEMQALVDSTGIAITRINVKYDDDGNVSDVLLNYEERGCKKT
nr:MAG TPA: hypothetical protein [Caudoviricetes sp.]